MLLSLVTTKRTVVKTNEIVIPRNPEGTDGTTKRFNRNLAILARELVPPELLIEFHLAVLQNHNPHLVVDNRTLSGWRVTWAEKGELQPTLAEKKASIDFLRQAGWGLPSQAHYIQADIQAHSGDSGVDLSGIAGSPEKLYGLVQALRTALETTRAGVQHPSLPGASDSVLDGSGKVLEGECKEVEVGDKGE